MQNYSLEILWKLYKINQSIGDIEYAYDILQQANNKIELYKNNITNFKYKNSFFNIGFNKAIVEEWEKVR